MLSEMGGELDLCFIPTGIHLHALMTVDVLRAGVNVVVEKPIAATVQEVAEMKKASEETGRFVAVGYQTMYVPETIAMKKKIVEGALGKIKTVKCRACWPRNEQYYTRNNWAGKLRVGNSWVLDSPFNNALAHQLNMICFLGGSEFRKSARLVEAQAELYRANPTIESLDTACLKFVSDSGANFFFIVTHASEEGFGPEISVVGEKGRIDWNNQETVFNIEGKVETLASTTHAQLREYLHEKVQQRVSDESAFICDPDIAGTQTLCVNGAHDSTDILPVDPEFVRKIMMNDSSVYAIDNIYGIIEEAFNQEKMFSELSVPWAKPSRVFPLDNYDFFPKKDNI
jgi:predicted dehydrogenase